MVSTLFTCPDCGQEFLPTSNGQGSQNGVPHAGSPPQCPACQNGKHSFADFKLHPATTAAIATMGITAPTPVQSQALPALLAGKDVIGQARTGSGKTLAFAVPIVERCVPNSRGVQALVLVPTRELAVQVGEVVGRLAAARRLRLTLLFGGRSLRPEAQALARGVDIVVGTPGRTLDHLRQGTLSLGQVKLLVLDEGDEMLDQGFAPDVERILSKTPAARQTAIFSATIPAWVGQMVARHTRNPVQVRIDTDAQSPPEIQHVVYEVEPARKFDALCTLLDQRGDGAILVFGRTKRGVQKLARQLGALGYSVVALQGNLGQQARLRAMADFRAGVVPVMVATNVAARGLDVADIDQVINYELPESERLFVHRVGRTGRMGREGLAITFITPDDNTKWRQIERALGRRFMRKSWPGQRPANGARTGTMPPASQRDPRPSGSRRVHPSSLRRDVASGRV